MNEIKVAVSVIYFKLLVGKNCCFSNLLLHEVRFYEDGRDKGWFGNGWQS